ncbi:hypothetical protein ASPSYDRAFT_89118 [Aspergillus sydowii CBS 593.65]|uniref:DUF4267 domain-containing protein n=1 Tax=Aspergillus sydowii CBS 593.65 TaxID=1036612 RepID=A0A1L9TLH7_9EURO|nr:uncharacterized protein ASPSYDRAFT_89118 [Aspergillus sydowii CBS 593.65]OJJ60242.1 hypothetical protein ASPSYDRAFT_89118 [Aspergillus sydowii CBS 593.65]
MALGTVADALARFIGVALVTSGPIWLYDPVKSVPVFGLPRTSPDIATFGPSLGGRNMAAGAIVLVSSFHASRSLTGIFLSFIATGAGWSDTAVCLAEGKGHKRHLLNIGIIYTVATLLIVA